MYFCVDLWYNQNIGFSDFKSTYDCMKGMIGMLPEEKARIKIDEQLNDAGWDIVSRDEYVPGYAMAIKEALMQGNKESDYLLFIDGKATAVVEAKKEDDPLGENVQQQAEHYASTPQNWYGVWFPELIPLVYLANGNKIYFKNMLFPDSEYTELTEFHTPKEMLELIEKHSDYGALPRIEKKGLRECQYQAELEFEKSLRNGQRKNLAILATGSGKTYLACLASYRLLNYTSVNRILFLVDRNNLARQTEAEYSNFDRTEGQRPMSFLYQINRLKKESDINGTIVISTIQKLFAVLTGQKLSDASEDEEDEQTSEHKDENEAPVELGTDLRISPDHFQFIIVDECHRSIYGKWKAVLDYFSKAKILGLTATPTPETDAFFNRNIIENYSYDKSVVDGVNVPSKIYRITTRITEHGGSIEQGETLTEKSRKTGLEDMFTVNERIEYGSSMLDRSVINRDQIKTVIETYKNAIYDVLYPDRKKQWEYIPKTLIFAKDDNHATEIVEVVKDVFKKEFYNENIPEHFVQKITYSAGDSNALIRDLRTEKDFRIAVTVTLVATGTDVKPLEVVLFMKDVRSYVLYTQMKGRGCRSILDEKLKEVTPNANSKDLYYIVDAVGVTETEKHIPKIISGSESDYTARKLSLEKLLEHLSHNEISDENLILLSNYCASIQRKYENSKLYKRHLDYFITNYRFAPREIANEIQIAIDNGLLTAHAFISASSDNNIRKQLISKLINNVDARKSLIEMQKGYTVYSDDEDTLISADFSKENSKEYIRKFEDFLIENKDRIEALRIIYNSEDTVITHSMLTELKDKLLLNDRQFDVENIWKSYKQLDSSGNVETLDVKVKALTNLIQLVRYAYKKYPKLTSILNGYNQRFSLYCGQSQRSLSEDQTEIMKQIADYIIADGAMNPAELNEIDTDLWRKAVFSFTYLVLDSEMITLSKFLLKVA